MYDPLILSTHNYYYMQFLNQLFESCEYHLLQVLFSVFEIKIGLYKKRPADGRMETSANQSFMGTRHHKSDKRNLINNYLFKNNIAMEIASFFLCRTSEMSDFHVPYLYL